MNGFAPLIEGFLAFALTMLALTTAVSAIVGAAHHLRRRHARGLRDMVRLLYERELVPLLRLGEPAEPAQTRDAHVAARAEFIYDMTIMPVPDVVEKLETRGHDYWRNKLASAEKLVGLPWYATLVHPRRAGRRWMTLRYGLAALKDEEFRDRLTSSDAGMVLQAKNAWTARGLASWDELVAALLKRFQTIGGASSETFARHSRGWSICVGFVLATLLNVDSLDLLNSYMADPALRQRVVEQSESIQAQEAPVPMPDGRPVLASSRARVDTATNQLADASEKLMGAVQGLTSTGSSADGKRAAGTIQSELQRVMEQAKGVQAGLADLDTDLTEADRKIRGVAQSLTSSFPIGWRRFPNCSSGDAPDLRCGGRVFARQSGDTPLWHRISTWVSATLPSPVSAAWSPLHAVSSAAADQWHVLADARAADPAAFTQWLIGVLLTGLLLGLGTPFWVQTVSAALSLRRWVTKKDDATKES